MLKATINTSRKVLNPRPLEVTSEERRLRSRNLAVLHGSTAEGLVKLDSLVRADSNLVLGGLGAEPEVDGPGERAGGGVGGGFEEDVRVALVELSVGLGGGGLAGTRSYYGVGGGGGGTSIGENIGHGIGGSLPRAGGWESFSLGCRGLACDRSVSWLLGYGLSVQ